MEDSPILTTCFKCLSPVHEFEDGIFGCDHCKSAWKFEDGAWFKYDVEKQQRINKNRDHERIKKKKGGRG